MGLSNFPHGFAHGINIRGIPLQVAHPGKVFWLNNSGVLPDKGVGASDGNDGSYLKPFSTLQGAISACTASRGDIIMVMPGHVEAVTSSSIALSKAGIAIIGLGDGDLRPLFNFGATTSNIPISANNISIKNVILKATIDQVVAGLTISGSGITLDIETRDTSAIIEFVSPIVSQSGANNLVVKALHRGFAAGSHMTRYIDLVGCRDADIEVDFFGIASVAVVNMRTTACDNIKVRGRFNNASVSLSKNVVNSTTSTWSVDGFDANGGVLFRGSNNLAISSSVPSALPQSVASSAITLGAGATTMFTITGGPIKVLEIIGIVTTAVQAQATSTKLTVTTTIPAATVDMSAAAVDLTGAAAGSSIRHINTTGVLTVVAAGFVNEGNAFATNDTQYLVPAGTININNASAANTGAITWFLRYVPLSPACRVV